MASVNAHLRQQIVDVRFTPTRLREGYDMAEVDWLLEQLVGRIDRGEPIGPAIDDVAFTRVKLREGYDIEEVDRFLAGLRRSADVPDVPAAYAEPVVPQSVPPVEPSTVPQVVREVRGGLLSRLFGRR